MVSQSNDPHLPLQTKATYCLETAEAKTRIILYTLFS